MAQNFWMVDSVPTTVAEWVESEVIEALTHYWTTDPPMIYMPENPLLNDGSVIVTCMSFEIPGPDGKEVCHEVSVNLLDELRDFALAYESVTAAWGGLSAGQVEDTLRRAARLRELALKINELAEMAEARAKTA